MEGRIPLSIFGFVVLVGAVAYIADRMFSDEPIAAPRQTGPYPEKCGEQPSDFLASEQQFEVTGVNLKEVSVGGIRISDKPMLIEMLGEAARNAAAVDYLVCVAVERGDVERGNTRQIDHLRKMLHYMQTGPTPDQFNQWIKDNPFPEQQSRLEAPDLEDIDGRKVLSFSAPSTKRQLRLVNAGSSPIRAWFKGFPEHVFFAQKNGGPWDINTEERFEIVLMRVALKQREFPFVIQTHTGQAIEAAIRLEGDWSTSEDTALMNSILDQLDHKGTSSPAASVYEVAKREVENHYPSLTKAMQEVQTAILLQSLDEPGAALIALEAAPTFSTEISENPSYYLMLTASYDAIGDRQKAVGAIERYESITGLAFEKNLYALAKHPRSQSRGPGDELVALQHNPAYWAMQSGDLSGTRYSDLAQIDRENVTDLRVAWTFSTGVLRGHEGGPLVIGDVMYVHTPFPNIVYALDLNEPGRIIWKYEPRQDPDVIAVMCCDTVNRGVAYGANKIILYQADTTVVALDASTGKELWKVSNGDPDRGETGTSAPMVFKDKVLIGVSGGEFGVRGHVTAYDLSNGKVVWRAYSTGPDSEMLMDPQKTTHLGEPVGKDSGTTSWEGDQWKIGGGTTWGWYSYDPSLNLIYYGTGNPGTWNAVQRPGDNRWSTSIFARDADTGMAKWVYQMTPHAEVDWDGVNEMILVDLEFDGQPRRALVHFDRNGFAYTLDRVTGELLVAEKYDPSVNWATHVDLATGRPQVATAYSRDAHDEDVAINGVCPSSLGTKSQSPAAFSPRTRLFYVPTNHVCMDYEPFYVAYSAGQPYVGATPSMFPAPGGTHLGNFIAWDGAQGKIVWSNTETFSVWSGALATAGDVIFYGTLEGYLKAVDAYTGAELWRFKTPSGIVGNVNTYMHGGKQYIAVLSGVGGWAGIGLSAGLTGDKAGVETVVPYEALSNYTQLGGVLTVFSLP